LCHPQGKQYIREADKFSNDIDDLVQQIYNIVNRGKLAELSGNGYDSLVIGKSGSKYYFVNPYLDDGDAPNDIKQLSWSGATPADREARRSSTSIHSIVANWVKYDGSNFKYKVRVYNGRYVMEAADVERHDDIAQFLKQKFSEYKIYNSDDNTWNIKLDINHTVELSWHNFTARGELIYHGSIIDDYEKSAPTVAVAKSTFTAMMSKFLTTYRQHKNTL
jgi:hypothetical protein